MIKDRKEKKSAAYTTEDYGEVFHVELLAKKTFTKCKLLAKTSSHNENFDSL